MSRLDSLLRQLTLANQLTLLRLAAAPALALSLLSGRAGWAFAIYVAAAVTDALDGMAARRLGQQTKLGTFLDPAADKLLMLVTYVTLALPDKPRPFPEFALAHHLPPWLALLVVARDVVMVMIALGLYMAYGESRFPPMPIGKVTTGVALITGGLFLLANIWGAAPDWLLNAAVVVTGALIVVSAGAYLLRTSRTQRRRDADADQ